MGILDAYNQWRVSRYDNHVSNMRSQNKCPDCRGKGYHAYPVNEFVYYTDSYECPGCNGTGQYSDWNELR